MKKDDDNLEFDFSEDEEPQPPGIVPDDGFATAGPPWPEIGDGEIPGLEPEELVGIVSTAIIPEDEPSPKSVAKQRPPWAVIILTIWIIAFYVAFYYFLIGHRFEKFSIGG
jgi:hypothetical protein